MRTAPATFGPLSAPGVHRVVVAHELAGQWQPDLRFLVLASSADERASAERLAVAGNVGWVSSRELLPGDVVAVGRQPHSAYVLFRETDVHHTLFVTNRCNSYCLMCSQPPTPHDDSWLVDEVMEAIRHIRTSPRTVGLSGGEPLLLGDGLKRVLDGLATHHPGTAVEVLTNGRLLANEALATALLEGRDNVTWLVPLYGHADFLHDFVVQRAGAFDETVCGLLALQQRGQAIQLRVVLIEPVLKILPELCRFIGRNVPFVREVALMGCEPIGFALANRAHCEVDLADWAGTLEEATRVLRRHAVPYLFMNVPLCALPQRLRPDAHRSISDWKNVYAADCEGCAAKADCSGLFAWHERGWKPTKILPIREAA